MPLQASKALATLIRLGAYLVVSREMPCSLRDGHEYLDLSSLDRRTPAASEEGPHDE